MNRNATLLLAAASSMVSCGGDLDDPDAYSELMPIRAIRSANVYPLTADIPGSAPPPGPNPTVGPNPTDQPSTGGAPGMGMPLGCARVMEIFQSTTCAGAACHGTAGSAAPHSLVWVDLTFDPANLATRLSTTMGSLDCAAFKVFDPVNPSQSLLLTKLVDPPPCGAPMPFGSTTPLSADDRQCITEWVNAEAQALAP